MSRARLISIRLPGDLLTTLDGMANAKNRTRSEVIVGLLRESFQHRVHSLANPKSPPPRRQPGPVAVKALSPCPRCASEMRPWGPTLKRCLVCQENFTLDQLEALRPQRGKPSAQASPQI